MNFRSDLNSTEEEEEEDRRRRGELEGGRKEGGGMRVEGEEKRREGEVRRRQGVNWPLLYSDVFVDWTNNLQLNSRIHH